MWPPLLCYNRKVFFHRTEYVFQAIEAFGEVHHGE